MVRRRKTKKLPYELPVIWIPLAVVYIYSKPWRPSSLYFNAFCPLCDFWYNIQ